jgi:hypothetical protein
MGKISIIVEGFAQLTGMLVLGHADIYYLWGGSKNLGTTYLSRTGFEN